LPQAIVKTTVLANSSAANFLMLIGLSPVF
jgi:hypothetical protein